MSKRDRRKGWLLSVKAGDEIPLCLGDIYWMARIIKVSPTGLMTAMVGSEEVTFNRNGDERGPGGRQLHQPEGEALAKARASRARRKISRPLTLDELVKIDEALS